MARHGGKRTRPAELLPGTVSCISARMDYWPAQAADARGNLGRSQRGLHIALRPGPRLPQAHARRGCRSSATASTSAVGPFGHRAFTDSAPVLEKALARNAGLGWIGKHTNLIDRDAGSYFFLGEIYLDLALPSEQAGTAHCGTCSACMPACPTGAIVAPYRLDARRCISYLTIELPGRFRSSSAAPSATASTAAMTANWRARGTSSRAPPPRRISPCATASITRSWPSSFPGARRNSCSARAAAPSAASAMSAGCATSPSRSAMRRPRRRCSRRCAAARNTPRPWCASTCTGRSRNTLAPPSGLGAGLSMLGPL